MFTGRKLVEINSNGYGQENNANVALKQYLSF